MSHFEETDEISNEEKLKIAQHYLLSSPPDQFQDILTDVRKLLPEGLLSDAVVASVAHTYNFRNHKVVVAPSGNKVVLAPAGEIDAERVVDPVTSAIFEVDNLTLQTHESSGVNISIVDESAESKRVLLQEKLTRYVHSHYPVETAAASVYYKDNSLLIFISGEKPNLKNFWSGKWVSKWNLSLASSTIIGDIKIHAHYFEDGNVQLQSSKNIPSAILESSSDEAYITAVVSHIKNCEIQLQNGLEEMYANMNDETFRAMRRIMPISRTKMEWNVNAVRMVKQVRK